MINSNEHDNLKISTMTITASLNVSIDLDNLYDNIFIADDDADGFAYAEYGKKNENNIFCKGFHKKLTIARRKKKIGKRFDNQITVIIKTKVDGKLESTNIKIFKNGNLQMAGIKSENHGKQTLIFLIDFLKKENENTQIVDNIVNINITNYKIQLINSDFRIGFNIKREKLFKILQNDHKDIYTSYEPCIYPGVKIQYSNSQCTKKTTIAVFRSGCVIITGAQKLQDTLIAYKFIKTLLDTNKEFIEMSNISLEAPQTLKKNKKKHIILPEGYILESN